MKSLEEIRYINAPKAFSDIDAVMVIETEDADNEAIYRAFQQLINSGLVWKLQGWYGRTAESLINAGFCHLAKSDLKDTSSNLDS